MPPQEQAELWMQLRDRMKVDWHELTLQEKKAGMSLDEESPMQDGLRRLHFSSPDTAPKASLCLYLTLTYWIAAWWIAFGPHGPRAEAPPGEWTRVSLYSGIGLAISAVLFLVIHSFSRPPPRTMTKEWQEATNEYLKVRIPLRFQNW
jgi:cytochrome c oxidase subunit 4